jgi:hypothetical protein
MNQKNRIYTLLLSLLIGISFFCSCAKNPKLDTSNISHQQIKNSDNKSIFTDNSTDETFIDSFFIDSIFIDFNNDKKMEKINITKGYYYMESYKFDVYDDRNILLGTIYSQIGKPWIDSLEHKINQNKILWTSIFYNGSSSEGEVYFGYALNENKLVQVITIPDSYYECFSECAEEGDPFKWGNITLEKISYSSPTELKINVRLDCHQSPSWDVKDSIFRTLYDSIITLKYTWIPESKEFLVRSHKFKNKTYDIQISEDLLIYLEQEYNIKIFF